VYKEKRCGACHAATGAGKPVAPPFADLVEKLATPLEVVTAMWNHAGKMEAKMSEENVAWPVLKGGEMADLLDYLLSGRGIAAPSDGSKVKAPAPKGQPR
jgi:mono/diheme cytochrome c family protein